ncbi:hypothetical protein ACSXEK_16310 (plasmid) [Clostridium perfringens]
MLVQKLEELMFKLCMLTVLFGIAKIVFFYIWHKLNSMKKLGVKKNKYKNTTKVTNNQKLRNDFKNKKTEIAKMSKMPEIIQTPELIDLKLQAKELFKATMQSKKLTRAEILDIKEYLLTNVGDPTLKNKEYKNDAHCIYSLLKSKYINENTLKKIIEFMLVSSNKKIS